MVRKEGLRLQTMKHWSHCSEDIGLLESMFLQQTAMLLLENPVKLLLEDLNYALCILRLSHD